jgi:intracellular sulfur oxidation DsrE/DsrF family protein
MDKLKVLFHVNEPDRWTRVFLNINNFILDAGQENVDIVVVANGGAVAALAGEKAVEKLPEELDRLAGMGVAIAACRNALKMHALEENTLPRSVTVVPAGITEIVKKQAAGYAYIKP